MSKESSSHTIVDANLASGLIKPGDSHIEGDYEAIRLGLCSRIESLSSIARHVLQLISEGHSNKAIALRLAVTEAAVKSHVTIIMKKLGCANRTQAALLALLSSRDLDAQARQRVRKIAFRRKTQ